MRQRVASASTRRTRVLADMIVDSVESRSVAQNPEQELAQFEQDVKTVTPDEVTAAARRAFAGSGPLLFMGSPKPIDGGEKALAAAYQANLALAVTAPTAVGEKAWPYERFGPAGKVVERKDLPEFGAVMVRFDNGARLTVKPTSFRKNEVQVQVRFGNGRLDLSKTALWPSWAGGAFIEGGLKQLTAEDIDHTLTKKVVGARFGLDDDAFDLSGEAQSPDLDTQLQLLAAYMTEPAFRPEAFQRVRAYGMTLDSQFEVAAWRR
jgi:zinc protease